MARDPDEDYDDDDDLTDDDDEREGPEVGVTVEIVGLSLYTHHGVTAAEREIGQRLRSAHRGPADPAAGRGGLRRGLAGGALSDGGPRWGRRPVLAGLCGATVIAFSAILVRLAEVEPSTAAVFRCLYAVPLLAVLAARETRLYGRRPWRDRWIGGVAGGRVLAHPSLWR